MSTILRFAGVAVAVAVLIGISSRLPRWVSGHNPRGEIAPWELVGSVLNDSLLHGQSDIGNGPAPRARPRLVYLIPIERTDDCTRIAVEMRIVARKFPRLDQELILTGADTARARVFVRANRVSQLTRFDAQYRIARTLRVPRTDPLILLLDEQDRVVYVDARSGGQFSAFPISRVLPALSGTLTGATTL